MFPKLRRENTLLARMEARWPPQRVLRNGGPCHQSWRYRGGQSSRLTPSTKADIGFTKEIVARSKPSTLSGHVGHVFINALSTVLSNTSNYCMQCLSTPNRGEVDRAHVKRIWWDIRTPSVRNFVSISPMRIFAVGAVLGVSSLPLHLL